MLDSAVTRIAASLDRFWNMKVHCFVILGTVVVAENEFEQPENFPSSLEEANLLN